MAAVAIGPFVFASDRFAALLSIAAFLILSEVLSRKVDTVFSSWAWRAVVAFIIGARVGHVITHAGSFQEEPWRILAIWQGGFQIEVGIALAVIVTLFCFRRRLRLMLWTALPGVVAAYIAMFVLQLTAGVPATPLPTGNNFITRTGEPFQPTDLEGRPVVINLWATWCPPCRREMPMMADMAANNDDAVFIFVNQGEGRALIERYLADENLALDHVVQDSLGEFGRHYEVPGLPATLFVNSEGKLRYVHMGEISREGLIDGIRKIRLAGQSTR